MRKGFSGTKILFLTVLVVFLVSERVIADPTTNRGARVVSGELIYVLCAQGVRVRTEDLRTIQFNSEAYERVTPFQGWGENKKTGLINGQDVTFVRIKFSADYEKVGWVAEQYLKLKSECPRAALPEVSTAGDPLNNITGLDDERCCLFPIENRPRISYLSRPAKFGAPRKTEDGRYRSHAATDLYTGLYKNVRAIAPGKIIRGPTDFYGDTKVIEIRHPGGFIARYGEISPHPRHKVRGIEGGALVRSGQVLAMVGQTYRADGSKIAAPMLHLELYEGTRNGALGTKGKNPPFYRRRDLINPTKYVQRWERMAF